MKPPLPLFFVVFLAVTALTALGAEPQETTPPPPVSAPVEEELVVPAEPLFPQPEPPLQEPLQEALESDPARFTEALLAGARESIRRAPAYDAAYYLIDYPRGDPGWEVGVSTDVVIRAFRHVGIDLQQRIHEDILAAPEIYGIEEPNPHIDHRRTRNLATFFQRHGQSLPTGPEADWQPGDLVFWNEEGKAQPAGVGIVADEQTAGGRPLVIHHAPDTTPRADDTLFARPIWAHFRWPLPQG